MATPSGEHPCLSAAPPVKEVQSSSQQKFSLWGDIMDSEFSKPMPLFDKQLLEEGKEPEGDEEEDEEMLARLHRDGPHDEEDDAILSVALVSRPASVANCCRIWWMVTW